MTDAEVEQEMAESLERARLKVAAEKEFESLLPPIEKLQAAVAPFIPPPFIPKASDPVNHPAHYTGGRIEAIDAIESAIEGLRGIEAFDTGQALRYLWRWKRKNGVEDLEKARWYLDHLLRRLKPGTGGNGA